MSSGLGLYCLDHLLCLRCAGCVEKRCDTQVSMTVHYQAVSRKDRSSCCIDCQVCAGTNAGMGRVGARLGGHVGLRMKHQYKADKRNE